MNFKYTNYIKERIEGKSFAMTEVELEASYIMREFKPLKDFIMIILAKSSIFWHKIAVHPILNSFKYSISEMNDYRCNLETILATPDDASKLKLTNSLAQIPVTNDLDVYIKGFKAEDVILRKVLEQRYHKVTIIPQHEKIDLKGLVYIPRTLSGKKIRLIPKDCTIGDFMSPDTPRITVPLHSNTLDSNFIDGIKWKEVLPSEGDKDHYAMIAGVKVIFVHIRMYIDAYENVFCTITNAQGLSKTTLISKKFDFDEKHDASNDNDKDTTDQKKKPSNKYPTANAPCYLIDTNVFIDHPYILERLDKSSRIVIAAKVIDELDTKKCDKDPILKRDAAKALSNIYAHEDDKRIIWEKSDRTYLTDDWSPGNADNKIFSVALKVKQQYNLQEIIILTKDKGFKIKTKFEEGISVQDYN